MNKIHGRENDSVAVVDEVVKSDVALREEAMLRFWQEQEIFKKSVDTPAGALPVGDFVFYDGPPFATGLPHHGHMLPGTIKDAIPRFWTMNGYRVERKWGWDCHGLPLENLIEKELGLGTKRDIEEYGVKNFNEAARKAVMRYADDWKEIIPRLGRFVDMEDDYKTMDSTYTESVWWVFSELNRKGLVYEGFKSMHLCPRCGTTLSNFEVNQGYKDIKDIAVTVKLPLLDDAGAVTDTSLLVWTTTPWTLPGNMAAAVHRDMEYVKVAVEGEFYVLAKGRLAQLGDLPHEVVEEMRGSDLVGRRYQPPFEYVEKQNLEGADKAWTIYHADYVELGEEGTGAVHIAPAYGEDDLVLAQSHGVPIMHHVDEAGHFKDFVTDFAGRLVKPKDDEKAGVDHKDIDIEILKFLQAKGKIFKKENISHSYPHCWRCDTPLLNYATTSWFVKVPEMKNQLVAANNAVKWVPEYVGTNRFGKWLEGARDWAISRQRYWGAPLPIWRNPETKEAKVIGSLKDLQQYVPKSGNRYVVMRHGESESNLEFTIRTDVAQHDPLTAKGIEQVRASAEKLKNAGIDMIIVSPFSRTRETADIVRDVLGLSPEAVLVDDRLKEIQVGDTLQGQSWEVYAKSYACFEDEYTTHIAAGVENRRDVQVRTGQFLFEIEERYQNKTILVVGHNSSTFAFASAAAGIDLQHAHEFKKGFWLDNAETREVSFVPYPHNDLFELDYHRPYIDDIALYENGVKLERIPDVFDCWFESGSMPYGQHHFMGEDKELFEKTCFPAQFVSEGLDQTRGWFYSMLVLGTALFGKSPFDSVIVHGLVLAEDGKKMSKKLKNYPDPLELANKVGVDSMRFYLLSSPAIKGEDLCYSEKEVTELQRKNIGRLHNVLAMYDMFADGTAAGAHSTHALDRWIIARLNQVIGEVSAGYKNYELDKATRPLTDFIDDLSVWYLRRSRDRFKGEDVRDKQAALATLRYALKTLALVMAPAMPFYAEYLWLAVKEAGDAESVHLAAWPVVGSVDEAILEKMVLIRDVVTKALDARTKAGIKVRQPLQKLLLGKDMEMDAGHIEIILAEVNVKEVAFVDTDGYVALDTVITEDLRNEGVVREFIRAVQELRAKNNLVPQDKIKITVAASGTGEMLLQEPKYQDMITKVTGAQALSFNHAVVGQKVDTDGHSFMVTIEKI